MSNAAEQFTDGQVDNSDIMEKPQAVPTAEASLPPITPSYDALSIIKEATGCTPVTHRELYLIGRYGDEFREAEQLATVLILHCDSQVKPEEHALFIENYEAYLKAVAALQTATKRKVNKSQLQALEEDTATKHTAAQPYISVLRSVAKYAQKYRTDFIDDNGRVDKALLERLNVDTDSSPLHPILEAVRAIPRKNYAYYAERIVRLILLDAFVAPAPNR